MHFYISKPPKMSIWVNSGPEFCPRDPSQTVGVRRRDSRNPGNATRDPPNAIPDSTNMPLAPQTHPRDRNAILYRGNRPNSAPIACARIRRRGIHCPAHTATEYRGVQRDTAA